MVNTHTHTTTHTQAHSMIHASTFYCTHRHIVWNTDTFYGTVHTGTLYMVNTPTRVLFRME